MINEKVIMVLSESKDFKKKKLMLIYIKYRMIIITDRDNNTL